MVNKKKTKSKNLKNSVSPSVEREKKQFRAIIFGFIKYGNDYRDDLISSKFKENSEEKLKQLMDFLPGVLEYIDSRTTSSKTDMSKYEFFNLNIAIDYYLTHGLIIAQHGKNEIAESCLSYIDLQIRLEKQYPEFYRKSRLSNLELRQFTYSEI